MEIENLHHWPNSYHDAVKLQEQLAPRITLRTLPMPAISMVAGVDVAAMRGRNRLWAAVVVLRFDDMELVEARYAAEKSTFPYIPGLLSFRELPVVLKAMRQLATIPDVIICDGQGLAHPRRFGLACHLGLWLNRPTLGCAKSRLVGEAREPGVNRGDFQLLSYQGRTVGSVLRTRTGIKPVFVSPGHLMDWCSAKEIVLACGRGKRLPEPTRLAHQAVNDYRKSSL